MKNKLKLLVVLLFAGIFTASAQGGGGNFQRRTPEERATGTVTRLTDSLALSKAQQTDITAVYLDFYKAQDKLREGLQPGERPAQADMDKLIGDRDAKLKVILKEDQFTHLKAMEEAMRNRGRQRPAGN